MKMFNLKAVTAGILAVTLTSLAVADTLNPSAIGLRDRTTAPATPAAANPNVVKLNVQPSKPSYRVGESIRFQVQGRDDYYLYVFNINNKTGEAVMLIPNSKTQNNRMSGNRTYDIPGTVDFYSDSVGVEQMVFIGTKQPLNVGGVTTQALGAFSVGKTEDFEAAFSSKAIGIRDRAPTASTAGATANGVTTLNLRIVQ